MGLARVEEGVDAWDLRADASLGVVRLVNLLEHGHNLGVGRGDLVLHWVEGLEGGNGNGEGGLLGLNLLVVGVNLGGVRGVGDGELVVRGDESLERVSLGSLLHLASLGEAHELGGGNLKRLEELLESRDGGLAELLPPDELTAPM